MMFARPEDKIKKDDRIIVLKPIDSKKPIGVYGNVDTRLFKGGNRLHAILNPQTNLWYLKYDSGGLPGALKQQYTSFNVLYRDVEAYFRNRNLEIERIED